MIISVPHSYQKAWKKKTKQTKLYIISKSFVLVCIMLYCDHDAIQVLMRHITLYDKPYLSSGLSPSLFSSFPSHADYIMQHALCFIPCRILLFSSKVDVLIDKGKIDPRYKLISSFSSFFLAYKYSYAFFLLLFLIESIYTF